MTEQQENALQNLYEALGIASASGLLDELAAEVHPDTINLFCDAVSVFIYRVARPHS